MHLKKSVTRRRAGAGPSRPASWPSRPTARSSSATATPCSSSPRSARRRRRTSTSSRSPSSTRRSCTRPGSIPGSYFKREGRLTEKETLTSRLVDRALPPAVPGGLRLRDPGHRQRHLLGRGERGRRARHHRRLGGADASRTSRSTAPSPASAWAASTASSSPTPPPSSASSSDLDLVMACSQRGHRHGRGRRASEVTEADMVAALEFGTGRRASRSSSCRTRCARELGVKTREYDKAAAAGRGAARRRSSALAWDGIAAGYGIAEKHDRYDALSTGEEGHRSPGSRSRWATAFTPRDREARQGDRRGPQVRAHARAHRAAAAASAAARTTRSAPSPARWACCPARTARRSSPAARPRRWWRPPWAPATTSSGSSCSSGMTFKRFMLHYNFPPFSRERDQAAARPGSPRDWPRRAGRARAAQHAARRARSSPTRSASSPTSSSPTAARPWPRSAAARWR